VKQTLLSLAVVIVMLATTVKAQEGKSTTRFQKQHKQTHFMKDRLKQTEASILVSLKGDNVRAQQTAIQTLRDLEQLFPEYPFSALIEPLETILRTEASDPIGRRLAALALDELHSDAGDAVIQAVAEKCDDKGLQTLCQALLVRNQQNL
jgi:hypothetical protein